MVRKMFGLCEAENGTKIDELLQTGASGNKRRSEEAPHGVTCGHEQIPSYEAWKLRGCQGSVGAQGGWRKTLTKEHDMVRRVDPYGEALVWCKECSGFARWRLEPKLMNCRMPGQERQRVED